MFCGSCDRRYGEIVPKQITNKVYGYVSRQIDVELNKAETVYKFTQIAWTYSQIGLKMDTSVAFLTETRIYLPETK